MKVDTFRSISRFVTSASFIYACLLFMMGLVLIGTFAQIEMGAFAAQRRYFNSFWIYADVRGMYLPIFPGGLTVGCLWLVSIVTATFTRMKWCWKNLGLILSHLGIILLIVGQGLTQLLAEETNLAIEEGETRNYSESSSQFELAFTETTDPVRHREIVIPSSELVPGRIIRSAELPFTIKTVRFFANSAIAMGTPSIPLATKGAGTELNIRSIPVTTKDDERNISAAGISILADNTDLGTWVVSPALSALQEITVANRTFNFALRAKRHYFPFSLTLKDFNHDIYPGTDIPKNFSSVVHINYPAKHESRDALIYMNHPLRFEGLTFYQASFGKNDTLSVFQVVRNPAWLTPYISCIIVTVGLLIQFLRRLLFKRSKTV